VAVFVIVPVPLAVAFTVNVAVPPLSRVTVVFRFPLPLAAPQLDPALAEQVQAPAVTFAGKLSTTLAPVAVEGPLFVTTIVYVRASP
jgi:hypothetical protein